MKHSVIYLLLLGLLVIPSFANHHRSKDSKIAYFKGFLPNQMFKCMEKFDLLKCLKFFILVRIESKDYKFPTVNSTSNFLEHLLRNEKNVPMEIPQKFLRLSDEELTERLSVGLQKFFSRKPITLKFMPDMMVQLVPSGTDYMEMSLKKAVISAEEGRSTDDNKITSIEALRAEDLDEDVKMDDNGKGANGKAKKEYYQLFQVGVPIMLMPAMFFFAFLPMIVPFLKLATIFTSIVNYGLLVSSVLYFARQHALEKEVQQTVYFNPGYKF